MFELPELPYDKSALEPHISSKTFDFHHGKHHKAYIDNLNNLIKDTSMIAMSLEEIIIKSAGDSTQTPIFNNAAQVFNHSFFWKCMKKNGGGEMPEALKQAIEDSFETIENFKEEFKAAAMGQFGSGWAWLVVDNNELKIMKTANADTPIAHGLRPILTIDVWEHAYYLDYQNRRADFITTFLENLVDWNFALRNLSEE